MASYQEESLELCLGHKREQSQDSGAYIDWNSEDSASPVSSTSDTVGNEDFITVVAVENGEEANGEKKRKKTSDDTSFVTILAIGEAEESTGKASSNELVEEVLVYRLPGERLGFGLKFEGGTNTAENVKRLFIQSSAPDSPASRAKCSWGALAEGDEILKIDGNIVKNMTRLDCVRCLKESSVVIKLYVRHRKQKKTQQSSSIKVENCSFSSPTVVSAEVKKNIPPPPPVPPRKIKKVHVSGSKEGSVNPPETFCDYQNDSQSPMPKTRTISNARYEEALKNSSKHVIRVPQENGQGSPDLSQNSSKRICQDLKLAPPEPKVYLDLLAHEESRNGESESDDTCSTVSTVVGLTSIPTTTNSSFSDIRSSASSFCDSTTPSTPTSEPTTPVLEISKILSPFDHLQNNDFLFSKLINIKYQDCEERNAAADELLPLQPPLNFQDAPLSYGNEEVRTCLGENLAVYEDEVLGDSFKTNLEEVPSDFDSLLVDGKSKEKSKVSKKPSLIPRLAKSMGLLSPPKPSPRKESKAQERSKSRFHKKKSPPPIQTVNDRLTEVENKSLKSSIPSLKKKKNKHDDQKKVGKIPKMTGDTCGKREIFNAAHDIVCGINEKLEYESHNVLDAPKTPEYEKKLTWEVPNLKNLIEGDFLNVSGNCEIISECEVIDGTVDDSYRKILLHKSNDFEKGGEIAQENCESQYLFPWIGSKQLETIGEDEEVTVDESDPKECEKMNETKNRYEEVLRNGNPSETELRSQSKSINEKPGPDNRITDKSEGKFLGVCKATHSTDESETIGSNHSNGLCGNQVLVKLDNDALEIAEKPADLGNCNGDLKEDMVPVVSTAISLVTSSASSFRMPPDGHEFPQKYSEKSNELEPGRVNETMTAGSQVAQVDAGLPPLPSSDPPSGAHHKCLPPIFGEGEVDALYSRKTMAADSTTVAKPPRNSFWRQDEKSEKSVRDKIAMFSSVSDAGASFPCPSNGSGNLSKFKSSEDVFCSDEADCSRNIQNGKLFSRSVMTLDKVTGPVNHSYMKKHSYGEATMPPRSLDYSNRAQSSMDLSSSSAYSSSCSPDSSLSSNSSSYLGYSSTLPRKKTRNEDNRVGGNKKDAVVQRTTSFSVHGRSQSLLDMNPSSYRSQCVTESLQEDAGSKSGALNLLIEQRRKNLTKLRGLVIPEKLGESASAEPIVDLPEIRSRDSILNTNSYKEKNASSKWASRTSLPEVTAPKVTPAHLWDLQNTKTPNIPKYSPAFKRKSISIFGGKEPLSLNVRKEISVNPAPKSSSLEPLKTPLKPPRNAPLVRQNSMTDDQKYQVAVTSVLCESEISYPMNKGHRINENPTLRVPKPKSMPQGRYRLHSDVGRSEEDSDNDSAVSSSRSSMSHGFSPPASPLLDGQYGQNVENSGTRQQVRLSPDSITLSRAVTSTENSSFETSESPLDRDINENNTSNKRILKAQSVEAINRKNVLTSAKYSRGFDVKSGSPLIQRRFSKEADENGNRNHDFPQTLNYVLSAGRKYANKEIEIVKDDSPQGQIQKIAYITDVIDEPILTETISKKKVEKCESVPVRTSGASSKRPSSVKKGSVPLEYSWGIEKTWNKAFEQVPVNEKEYPTLFDKTEGNISAPDKDIGLKMNNGKEDPTNADAEADLLNDSVNTEKLDKSKVLESTGNRFTADKVGSRSVSVNDIRRTFEKAETLVPGSLRSGKTGNAMPSSQNGLNGNHARMSSLDSTTSDDGPYGYSSNLFREQFGSITSLASSTSLISPQELQLLIEEANQTLEESGNANGGSSSNNHDVLVVILHRDTVGGSIGITLAGGADYESKEITVHKVLAGSPADRDGRIQKGDRILSINGKSMKGVTHRESLAILKSLRLEVVLVVSRLKTDSDNTSAEDATSAQTRPSYTSSSARASKILERSTFSESDETLESGITRGPPVILHLMKDGSGLGFSLEGGKDCSTGDKPLVIKKIFTGGVAEKCGQLKAGDELVSINGIDVSSMTRIDAWKLMKALPDGTVAITVKLQVVDSDGNSNSRNIAAKR